MRKALLALLVVASLSAIVAAQQLSTGVNNNLSGCIGEPPDNEYVCDPFLRQKVEPKAACSSLNSEHCMVVANDYRSVGGEGAEGTGEGLSLNTLDETLAKLFGVESAQRTAANPDAWIGIYRCYHGVEGPCVNGLWPGFPSDSPPTADSPKPEFGFAAASDPKCDEGRGLFGCIAMFFDRGGRGVIVTRFFRDFNDESKHPIRLDPSIPPFVHVRGSAVAGKFADLPNIFFDGRRWIVVWTQFHADGAHGWETSSTDGKNWTPAENIGNPFNSLQRIVLAVDKRPVGVGLGGTAYAMFRTFNPNGYAVSRMGPNATKFTTPVSISTVCPYDAPSRGANEVSDPDFQFARAKDFASIDTDPGGNLYVVHTERVNADGTPLSPTQCSNPNVARSSPAAIVLYRSTNGGQTFSSRKAIDIGVRCETVPQRGLPARDVTPPNATSCPTGTAIRPAGVQMQPSLRINGGHIVVTYREGYGEPVLGPAPGYFSGRSRRMDIRAAQIDRTSLALLATRQVSQYDYNPDTGNYVNRTVPHPDGDIAVPAHPNDAHLKVNLPNLPQFQNHTTPFGGDSDDLVAVEERIADDSGTHFATAAEVPALRMVAVWGADNREAGFPLVAAGAASITGRPVPSITGPWEAYGPPGSGASCINPTIKFSNVFASLVTGPVEAWAVQTFKPLGGTEKKTWPVVIRNRGPVAALYRVNLVERPGFVASFDSLNDTVKEMGLNAQANGTCATAPPSCTPLVRVLPGSSVSLTVFGYAQPGTNVRVASPIRVLVDDVATTPKNPDAIVRLNPDPIQYDFDFFGPGASTVETHGRPSLKTLGTEYVKPPYTGSPKAPSGGNPSIGEPSLGEPSLGEPSLGESSITEIQYVVTTGTDANTASGYQVVANFADAHTLQQQVDAKCTGPGKKCHQTQVIISRTHTIPTITGCTAGERPADEIVSYTALGAAPSLGEPSLGEPSLGEPSLGEPSLGESNFTLTPLNAPLGTLSANAYTARAVASAAAVLPSQVGLVTGPDGTVVGDPPPDAVLVTYRIVHYHGSDVIETAPTTKEAADKSIGVAAVPKAKRSKAGGLRPVAGNDQYSTFVTVTLPVSAANGVLRDDIKVTDTTAPLRARLVSGPAVGTLTFRQDGSFTYKPKGNFVGVETFRYRAIEGTGNAAVESADATVVITVLPKN